MNLRAMKVFNYLANDDEDKKYVADQSYRLNHEEASLGGNLYDHWRFRH